MKKLMALGLLALTLSALSSCVVVGGRRRWWWHRHDVVVVRISAKIGLDI